MGFWLEPMLCGGMILVFPGALTLQQVVERARAANPTLLAAEANLRGVRASEIKAAVRTNPYLAWPGSDVTEAASSNSPISLCGGTPSGNQL